MAGVKSRSGGARKNSGGARPGAGRPKGSKTRTLAERALSIKPKRIPFTSAEKVARAKARYLANRERLIEYQMARYHANKDTLQQANREWKQAHREQTRKHNSRYRQKDPERTRSREKASAARQRDNLTDGYVRARLRDRTIGLNARDIPQDMVEAARVVLKLKHKLPDLPVTKPQFVCRSCGTLYEPKWYRPSGKHAGQGTHYCSRECAFTDIRNWQNRKYQYRPATIKGEST